MLSLIPLPYRVLIGVALLAAIFASGVASGHHWATVSADAARTKAVEAKQIELNKQITVGNDLADKLAKAESTIVTHNVEVIKYVDKHTTGRDCLSPAVVSMLQPGSNTGLRPPARQPAADDAGASATDTDIGEWIAQANQQYDLCAARLNGLIDFEEARP